MTTNQTPIPEPTSPTAVVVGKRDGKPVVAARIDDDDTPWAMQYPDGGFQWTQWPALCHVLTDIRVVDVADVAAKPEPGPWLLGDELEAVMPTLKAGDVVEVEHDGHKVTGGLWPGGHGFLALWAYTIRATTGKPGPYIDALRIVERAPEPEPGADIPDEVVKAAHRAYWDHYAGASSVGPNGDPTAVRIALAAADAKRAELEERF